jgi:hypothetical protein
MLGGPWGICALPTNELLVCDYWNHRLQVFDAQVCTCICSATNETPTG